MKSLFTLLALIGLSVLCTQRSMAQTESNNYSKPIGLGVALGNGVSAYGSATKGKRIANQNTEHALLTEYQDFITKHAKDGDQIKITYKINPREEQLAAIDEISEKIGQLKQLNYKHYPGRLSLTERNSLMDQITALERELALKTSEDAASNRFITKQITITKTALTSPNYLRSLGLEKLAAKKQLLSIEKLSAEALKKVKKLKTWSLISSIAGGVTLIATTYDLVTDGVSELWSNLDEARRAKDLEDGKRVVEHLRGNSHNY